MRASPAKGKWGKWDLVYFVIDNNHTSNLIVPINNVTGFFVANCILAASCSQTYMKILPHYFFLVLHAEKLVLQQRESVKWWSMSPWKHVGFSAYCCCCCGNHWNTSISGHTVYEPPYSNNNNSICLHFVATTQHYYFVVGANKIILIQFFYVSSLFIFSVESTTWATKSSTCKESRGTAFCIPNVWKRCKANIVRVSVNFA